MTIMSGDTEATEPNMKVIAAGGIWNHHPTLPIHASPVTSWSLQSLAIQKTILGGWLPISEELIVVGVAVLTSFYFTSFPETTNTLAPVWGARVLVRTFHDGTPDTTQKIRVKNW